MRTSGPPARIITGVFRASLLRPGYGWAGKDRAEAAQPGLLSLQTGDNQYEQSNREQYREGIQADPRPSLPEFPASYSLGVLRLNLLPNLFAKFCVVHGTPG